MSGLWVRLATEYVSWIDTIVPSSSTSAQMVRFSPGNAWEGMWLIVGESTSGAAWTVTTRDAVATAPFESRTSRRIVCGPGEAYECSAILSAVHWVSQSPSACQSQRTSNEDVLSWQSKERLASTLKGVKVSPVEGMISNVATGGVLNGEWAIPKIAGSSARFAYLWNRCRWT